MELQIIERFPSTAQQIITFPCTQVTSRLSIRRTYTRRTTEARMVLGPRRLTGRYGTSYPRGMP